MFRAPQTLESLGLLALLGFQAVHAFHAPAQSLGGLGLRGAEVSLLKSSAPRSLGHSALSLSMSEKKQPNALRRSLAAFAPLAAWQLSSQSSSAWTLDTFEKVVQDPSQLATAFDRQKVKEIVTKWKQKNAIIKDVSAASAATYTVEYDEFVQAVKKAGKVKIGGEVVQNPSEAQLLQAWKAEEVRRAKTREEKGEEPLTRPIKLAKEQGAKEEVFYLPPVVTKESSDKALALGKHLKEIGAVMYGAYWCSHCYNQKQNLGEKVVDGYLTYVECDKKGAFSQRDMCKEKKVPGFPTWEIKGTLYPGEKSLEDLAKVSGFQLE